MAHPASTTNSETDALTPHAGGRRGPAWARWLTTPVAPEDEVIRDDLTDLLYGNRSSIAFAIFCLGIVLLCYGIFLDITIAALLTALLVPAATLRYLTISGVWRGASPTALLAAGLFWAAVVGLVCGEGARTDDMLLTVLSGLVIVAIGFGGGFNNAGAPRFAYIQTILFIGPYALLSGLSSVPGMIVIPLQLPLWLIGIFKIIHNIHCTHAKLIRAQRLAHHLAFHDSLTGLPNRAQFMERLARECETAAHKGSTGASYVFYLDLDGFKPVNDTFGHATGDELLRVVAKRFEALMRPGDMLGRLGGDEFAAILCDVTPAEAEAIGSALIASVRDPFHLDGLPPITIGVSIGGVSLGLPPDMRRALHAADTMLYAAKRSGKGMLRLSAAA